MSNRKVSVYSHVIESLFSKSLSLYFAISGGAPIAFTYGILYNLILILAIIALSIPTVYYYSGYVYKNDPIVSLIVDIIHILTTVVILGIFCVKGKTQALLFFKINKIKNHMFKNYLYSNINSSMKTTLRIIIGNGLWLTCVIATFFHNYKYTLYFQGSMLCSFTKNSIVFQYCAISILLRDMFEMLNCKLLEMCAKVDGELQLSFLSVDIFNELSDLWDSHSKLTDICQEISSFYSLSIFTFIINQFMTTTIGVYYLSRPFFVDGVPDNTKLTNISEILYLLRHIYILMFLTTSISATVNESRRTRRIVYDFMNKRNSTTVRQKLKYFLMYLSFDNVKFSMFGVVALDDSLLISIAGSIATYLVILVQFERSNNNGNHIIET